MSKVNYKFYEDKLIKELHEYVDKTYDQHYATDKYQATDVIIDSGHGTGFCLGNVIKYAKRYGNKGSACDARNDLMKILHYTLIQLYIHDEENKTKDRNPAYGPYPEYNKNYSAAPFHHDPNAHIPRGEWNFSIDAATVEEWNEVNRKFISESGGFNPDAFSISD